MAVVVDGIEIAMKQTEFDVHVDLPQFRSIFIAQNGNLQRLAGAILVVICGLILAGLLWLATQGAFESFLEGLELSLLFIVLFVFGLFVLIHPVIALSGRKALVEDWFARHGSDLSKAQGLSDLVADYHVSVQDYGFVETSGDTTNRVPWFLLSGKNTKVSGGHYFLKDNGADNSALYNLIGINWAFRKEDVAGSLFIPESTASEELISDIRKKISASRALYAGRSGAKRIKTDTGLADWMLG